MYYRESQPKPSFVTGILGGGIDPNLNFPSNPPSHHQIHLGHFFVEKTPKTPGCFFRHFGGPDSLTKLTPIFGDAKIPDPKCAVQALFVLHVAVQKPHPNRRSFRQFGESNGWPICRHNGWYKVDIFPPKMSTNVPECTGSS